MFLAAERGCQPVGDAQELLDAVWAGLLERVGTNEARVLIVTELAAFIRREQGERRAVHGWRLLQAAVPDVGPRGTGTVLLRLTVADERARVRVQRRAVGSTENR